MRHNTVVFVAADPETVGAALADLSTHVEWNDVVAEATPVGGGTWGGHPAWDTTLRANVGPFARSKRLRMVRTGNTMSEDGTRHLRFERREVDGRDHAEWIMTIAISAREDGSMIDLGLEYTGGLWVGALDSVLGAAIDRAVTRLPDWIADRPDR